MLHDFPAPLPKTKLMLYADDVTVYTQVDHPVDSEDTHLDLISTRYIDEN